MEAVTVTFCPFLSSQPNHNPSEMGSQPFLPRSLAQKPPRGQNQVVGTAGGGVMQRQNQNLVQKSIFLRQKTTGAGTNGSAQCSEWEQRQGGITGPLPLICWCIEFISASLCCAKPLQDSGSLRAVLAYQQPQAAENSSQINCFFWVPVK